MEILEQLILPEAWREFLQYKTDKQHLSKKELTALTEFIESEGYLSFAEYLRPDFYPPLPQKKELNKEGVTKKRVVYSFPDDFNLALKLIAFFLYRYDSLFADNCYAFRRDYGVKDAVRKIRMTKGISQKYCLKVDIRNYFNSVDTSLLLERLSFLKKEDAGLYRLFTALLSADAAVENGKLLYEKRGAMAGTPISPFFANLYLSGLDYFFSRMGVLYFRYSDDILLFADSRQELAALQTSLYSQIAENRLSLNPSKVHISVPGEPLEFLGFCFADGRVDLSENTKRKIKGKIRRKAHALRRWQKKKGLDGEKAAKGFIHAMNHKFYASEEGTEFTWSRWFFPNLTTDAGLHEIDTYMQQYIRYTCTGRHYKGNYRISYEQLKAWGYRSLVHEYYLFKKAGCSGSLEKYP